MSLEWIIALLITVILSVLGIVFTVRYAKKSKRGEDKILAEIRKLNEKLSVSEDDAKKIGEKIRGEIPEPSKDYSDNYEPEIRQNKEDTEEVTETYTKSQESNTETFKKTNEGIKASKNTWKSEETRVVHKKK